MISKITTTMKISTTRKEVIVLLSAVVLLYTKSPNNAASFCSVVSAVSFFLFSFSFLNSVI